jgi:hypothetical protein
MELSLAEKLEAAVEALRRCEERSLAGQFALEVMHEVRNPLDAIGNLVYLGLAAKDLPQAREYMRAATEHIVSLHQIAGQSLTLTQHPDGDARRPGRALRGCATGSPSTSIDQRNSVEEGCLRGRYCYGSYG